MWEEGYVSYNGDLEISSPLTPYGLQRGTRFAKLQLRCSKAETSGGEGRI